MSSEKRPQSIAHSNLADVNIAKAVGAAVGRHPHPTAWGLGLLPLSLSIPYPGSNRPDG
jgi:hypothetical protein